MSTQTIFCPNCGGAVPVHGRGGSKQTCPYCEARIWVALTNEEVGAASARMMDEMQRLAGPLSKAQEAVMDALRLGDDRALEHAIVAEAQLTFSAYDAAGSWSTFGCSTKADIDEHKRRHIETMKSAYMKMAPTLRAAATGQPVAEAPPSQQDELFKQYSAALERQDLNAFVPAFRQYMHITLATTPGWENQPPEAIEQGIMTSLEATLRNESWVKKEDLERLGIKTHDDVRVDAHTNTIEVDCQSCGASLSAPLGTERVRCPYCEAVTHVQLYGEQSQRAVQQAMAQERASLKDAWKGPLEQARALTVQATPSEAPESPLRHALSFFYLRTAYGTDLAQADIEQARQALSLGPDRTCGICQSVYAAAQGLSVCPVCRQA